MEVFECCINGQEISPGYTEQNNPIAQRTFKAKVGLEALAGVKTAAEIAREYQVHPTQISHWRRVIEERLGNRIVNKYLAAHLEIISEVY